MAESKKIHLNNFTGSSISLSGGAVSEKRAKAKAGKGLGTGMTPGIKSKQYDKHVKGVGKGIEGPKLQYRGKPVKVKSLRRGESGTDRRVQPRRGR